MTVTLPRQTEMRPYEQCFANTHRGFEDPVSSFQRLVCMLPKRAEPRRSPDLLWQICDLIAVLNPETASLR